MEIGAMDQRIRMMEFFAERVAERNARDFLAGDRIQHHEIVWKHRERADRLDQAELFEHPEHVGPELDAGADLLEFGGLIDDLRRNPLPRQRERGGEPANAAADNEDLLVFPGGHLNFPSRKHCPPPHCGEGLGVGVKGTVASVVACTLPNYPPPYPPPQGGRE